ncbi:Uncharacterised protein [Vibrio cholerae]|nr:Uncharacterised protein [Vibrio cholerae]
MDWFLYLTANTDKDNNNDNFITPFNGFAPSS